MDWECLTVNPETGEPNITSTPINGYPHGSYFYFNEYPGATDTWSVYEMEFSGGLKPGRTGGSALGLDMLKPATNWGCGLGITLGDSVAGDPTRRECIDFSQYSGISFWVKGYIRDLYGDSSDYPTVNVSFATQSTIGVDAAAPGSCTLGEDCWQNQHSLDMTGKEQWTRIELPWSSFTGGSASFDPSEVRGLNFHVMGEWGADQELRFHIDDVELYPGPSQLPRTCE
jgi:hypothetical protein